MLLLWARRRAGGARRRPHRPALAWLVLVAVAVAGSARGQGADGARVILGLGGKLVAGAWNPLEVTVRDAAATTLEVRIDEGDLVTGPRIVRYRASLPGGSGVSVFDDDLYVPAFQTLSWRLVSAGRVLASGSLGAREADGRPLQVVVSADPGAWRAAYPSDARVVDVAAPELPARAAAYDGVASLLIDGTAASPRTASVAAAAAGGAEVLLAGALPASQAGLARLAGSGVSRLGAGEVRRVPASVGAASRALADWHEQDRGALLAALAATPLVRSPRSAPQPLVLSLAAAYALLALLSLRFGGTPGVLATVALALVLSVAGWRLMRPPAAVISAGRTLMVGGGELALGLSVAERLTLPAGEVSVAGAARPLTPEPYLTDAGGTHVQLPRWHGVTLALRPSLGQAALRYQGGRLRNAGTTALRDVYVVGMGAQGDLAAGASRAVAPGEEGAASPMMARLGALLPRGTALAEGPQRLWVALPPTITDGGTPP